MAENKKNVINEIAALLPEEKEFLLKCLNGNGTKRKSRKQLWHIIGILPVLIAIVALTLFLPEEYLIRCMFLLVIAGILFNIIRDTVSVKHPENEIEKIKITSEADDEQPLLPLTEKDLNIIALHEAGHAVCNYFLSGTSEMRKIQIDSQDKKFDGIVCFKESPNRIFTATTCKNIIAEYLGGIVAERMILGEVSCGAERDLASASQLAYEMTSMMGMGKRIGLFAMPVTKELFQSDMEADIRDIICESQTICEKTLAEHRDILEQLTAELLTKKTLNELEIKEFFTKASSQSLSSELSAA